jgi:hypothetical protein
MGLIPFLPKYLGLARIAGNDATYIQLENLLLKFRKPCVLDLKMGTQTYDEWASQEKIDYELMKYPLQAEIGFRFTGSRVCFFLCRYVILYWVSSHFKWAIQIWLPRVKRFNTKDKKFGFALNHDTITPAFSEFFRHNSSTGASDCMHCRLSVIPSMLQRLLAIRSWFSHQQLFRFYASSLLFIYEGDTGRVCTGLNERGKEYVDEGGAEGIDTEIGTQGTAELGAVEGKRGLGSLPPLSGPAACCKGRHCSCGCGASPGICRYLLLCVLIFCIAMLT